VKALTVGEISELCPIVLPKRAVSGCGKLAHLAANFSCTVLVEIRAALPTISSFTSVIEGTRLVLTDSIRVPAVVKVSNRVVVPIFLSITERDGDGN
jgi:hypothetical protein